MIPRQNITIGHSDEIELTALGSTMEIYLSDEYGDSLSFMTTAEVDQLIEALTEIRKYLS